MDNKETPEEDSEAADQFQAWMNEICQSDQLEDYSPFPSKICALLYFLVHGPNPVVSSGKNAACMLYVVFYLDSIS